MLAGLAGAPPLESGLLGVAGDRLPCWSGSGPQCSGVGPGRAQAGPSRPPGWWTKFARSRRAAPLARRLVTERDRIRGGLAGHWVPAL